MFRLTTAALLVAGTLSGSYAQTAQSFVSNHNLTYRLATYDAPVKGNGSAGGKLKWALSVDDTPSGHRQTVQGFGATVTDATVDVISALSADKQDQLLSQLLTDNGAKFTLMRHSVGASDLSAAPAYTYDDNNGKPDLQLSNFALGARGTKMAQLLAKMQSVQPGMHALGSPWSPPGWMKTSGKLLGTTVSNTLNHAYASQYAQYFVRYIQEFQKLGANVDSITIQNEPLNNKGGFPTMNIAADEAAGLIQNQVGPALKNAGLGTQIWAWDLNTGEPHFPSLVSQI